MLRILPLLLVLGACIRPDEPHDPQDTSTIEIEIPRGASASGLTPELLELDLIASDWRWRWFLRGEDASCIRAGRFEVSRSMSMRELLDTLCGSPLPEDVPFTVVEGWRIRDIDDALASRGWIEPGEYARVAEEKAVEIPFETQSPTLEGFLYPETYGVIPDRLTARGLIERQLAAFQKRFLDDHEDHPKLVKRGLDAIVIMASMLEREEPVVAQRPVVAGILWKRLDHDWKLGVDATSRYTLDEWNNRQAFLGMLRDPGDPYNTRLRHGLPPTAIGNPSLESLEATLEPKDSPYWYYLHDAQGVFHGAVDARGHTANRREHNVW